MEGLKVKSLLWDNLRINHATVTVTFVLLVTLGRTSGTVTVKRVNCLHCVSVYSKKNSSWLSSFKPDELSNAQKRQVVLHTVICLKVNGLLGWVFTYFWKKIVLQKGPFGMAYCDVFFTSYLFRRISETLKIHWMRFGSTKWNQNCDGFTSAFGKD